MEERANLEQDEELHCGHMSEMPVGHLHRQVNTFQAKGEVWIGSSSMYWITSLL
jgi:hypothetical protein